MTTEMCYFDLTVFAVDCFVSTSGIQLFIGDNMVTTVFRCDY